MDACATYKADLNLDSSESPAYNNPLFPAYVRYGCLSSYPDYSAISHWHEDLEFILVKKGSMTYDVNGESVELTAGNGIMVNSGQLHYGFSKKHRECEFICILLSTELLQGNEWFYQNFIRPVTGNLSYPCLYLENSGWQAAVLENIDRLYHIFGSGTADSTAYFELLETFVSILKLLFQNLNTPNSVPAKESAELISLRKMIRYIEEHFAERITLENIALAGACCKSKCSMLFKKYLHATPITYITKLRLRKSLAALLNSDAPITAIAYEHGFSGASYYCETFQKYYGISPLKYRKSHLQ